MQSGHKKHRPLPGWEESFPGDTVVKNLPDNPKDAGNEHSIPGLGNSLGEGLPEKFHGERNLQSYTVHGITKGRT